MRKAEIRQKVYTFCQEQGLLLSKPQRKELKKILLEFGDDGPIVVKQVPKPPVIKPKTESQIHKERLGGTFYNSDFIQRN
jgi:hypothetical protein